MVAGEMKTSIYAPIQEIARKVIKNIGYTDANFGFDYKSVGVLNCIGEQSPDISQGVDQSSGEIGAGDQGLIFGYACDETKELMPLPISLAHKLTHKLAEVRKNGTLNWLRPDGKAQVSIKYIDSKPVGVDTIVVSAQHHPNISQKQIREDIIKYVIKTAIPKELINDDIIYHINPTGKFIIGGPQGDAGLTGRKIIVDTYGGYAPHGGGAFSGKDPTKVDRSAAYMARYIAKNLVAAGVAKEMTIQISYAIGVVQPVSIMVNTNSSKIENQKIVNCIKDIFDLSPSGIIKELNLLNPIYLKTASYGHFGRENLNFSWEKLNRVNDIKKYF